VLLALTLIRLVWRLLSRPKRLLNLLTFGYAFR